MLHEGLSLGIGSGMAAAWGSLDAIDQSARVYAGFESHARRRLTTVQTQFDLASLTKILATTSLYLIWFDQGILDLDSKYPGRDFTFRQLLTHSSGLPAWKPFYESMIARYGDAQGLLEASIEERKAAFYEMVATSETVANPGEKIVYSDLGFLLLSLHAERITGLPFQQIIQEQVWSRIENCGLQYRPLDSQRRNEEGFAATELCPWRGILQGEVHDDNAWSMGGVAGHAGVFGTLEDVVSWMKALISGQLASFRALREFSKTISDSSGTRRAVGFDAAPLDGSGSTAMVFSPVSTIGHLGFTGTSLWMDLDQGDFAVLLTNRVHPSREDIRICPFRRAFHQTAFDR